MPQQLQTLIDNLKTLGTKRLAAMAAIAALVMSVIVVGSLYLNRPAHETLYVNLDHGDVSQIGTVLSESGISFDVTNDGTSVMVPVGQSGRARMLLAERGLPTSSSAGYELFDEVGSFGLTSFMQQVTRVRAMEGEIARTIQSLAGVRAARVHIVMPERASFRREEQPPSASVVIRADNMDAARTARAIRHMVSAAVPGLAADKVTVLDSSGEVLAAGDDPLNNSVNRAIEVERSIESQIQDNIRQALAPYLGPDNFRASVRAEVNTDSRQIEETIYDPESRVERSVQVVRSSDEMNQRQAAPPATVEQNLPEENPTAGEGPASSEMRERREETTNYELNSRRIATISNGYSLTKMSIAVVVNRERLAAVLGADATPEAIGARIDEIRQMVSSATGLSEERGDAITVSSVEFLNEFQGVEVTEPGIIDMLAVHTGTMINALAFIIVAALVSWFGLRPLVSTLTRSDQDGIGDYGDGQLALPNPLDSLALPGGGSEDGDMVFPDMMADDIRFKLKPAPQDRLAQMVDLNEERTALILRKWAAAEAA